MRKVLTTAAGAACIAMASTGTAAAAGGGYGGSGANGGSTPAGFTSVSAVYTVPVSKGGTVGTTSTKVTVPTYATSKQIAIVLYKGNASTAKKYRTPFLSKDKVIATFGVGLFSGPTAVRSTRPITVTYYNSALKPGDHLAVYNTRTHKFQAVAATFSKGKVTFKIEAGQSVAVFS